MLQTNFPSFIDAPMTESTALSQGWSAIMECGDDDAPGNVYAYEGDLAAMPFYNADGNIAGIILGMEDPGALVQGPPYTPYTTPNGSTFWGIEANFRDPATICTEGSTGDVAYGDRLWFANGSHSDYSKTPLTQDVAELDQEGWVLGACKAYPFQMGTHWWRYSSNTTNCNESYPIFLLYDDDDRLHAWGVAMGNSDRPALTESLRWEHPPGDSLTSFFAPGGAPVCLVKQSEAYNSQHVYMTNNSATTCITTTVPTSGPTVEPDESGAGQGSVIIIMVLAVLLMLAQ